jgi:hypothetical protein
VRLQHSYEGGCYYVEDADAGNQRLLVALLCRVGDLPDPHYALLDTGSPWCVLPPATAEALGRERPTGTPDARMSTRLGTFEGWLDRITLDFPVAVGAPLMIEATWFVAGDWPGPMVLGWKGALERLRWAVDPAEQAFYIAGL